MPFAPRRSCRPLSAAAELVVLGIKTSILNYFRHPKERIEYEWDNGKPVVGELFSPALIDMSLECLCKTVISKSRACLQTHHGSALLLDPALSESRVRATLQTRPRTLPLLNHFGSGGEAGSSFLFLKGRLFDRCGKMANRLHADLRSRKRRDHHDPGQ